MVSRVVQPKATPGSQSSLREANRARLVDALTYHGRLTQVELAEATGLSPASVSNIVKELSAAGVLHTSGTSRNGRRAVLVTLARQLGLVAGLHFSDRLLRAAISDTARTIVAETYVPLAPHHRFDSELDRAALLLAEMAGSVGADVSELLAIGMGVPAPVDSRTGMLAPLGLMRNWEGVDLAATFEGRTAVRTVVESEANLGAMAVSRLDHDRAQGVSVFIRVGHSISAGIVIDGSPYRGVSGKAGQLGHLTIDANGAICRCGNRGCLETVAGGHSLLGFFRTDPSVQRLTDLIHRTAESDPRAVRLISDAGYQIGIAAAGLCNLLDPDRLVIGGELARTGEILISPMRQALERSVLGGPLEAPSVEQNPLGDRAELLGALSLAIDTVAPDLTVIDAAAP